MTQIARGKQKDRVTDLADRFQLKENSINRTYWSYSSYLSSLVLFLEIFLKFGPVAVNNVIDEPTSRTLGCLDRDIPLIDPSARPRAPLKCHCNSSDIASHFRFYNTERIRIFLRVCQRIPFVIWSLIGVCFACCSLPL